jgi:hypothetical protein
VKAAITCGATSTITLDLPVGEYVIRDDAGAIVRAVPADTPAGRTRLAWPATQGVRYAIS